MDGAVQKALAKHQLITPPTAVEEEAPKRKKTDSEESGKRSNLPFYSCNKLDEILKENPHLEVIFYVLNPSYRSNL